MIWKGKGNKRKEGRGKKRTKGDEVKERRETK